MNAEEGPGRAMPLEGATMAIVSGQKAAGLACPNKGGGCGQGWIRSGQRSTTKVLETSWIWTPLN